MKKGVIIKSAEWTLAMEDAEGAPRGIFSTMCITCKAESEPVDDERLPVEMWALKHTGLNPTHRQFKAVAETFWRASPMPGNPYFEGEAMGKGAEDHEL